uniref:Uncharacterized protein n=1 Tax=Hyaloperonospora arabidopsidis (strain Emoy2) TaxID=559515 RepID=M4C383_HYAAE
MVSSVSDEGDHSLQVPSSSYMEFLSPRLPSSGARSRAVNMRRRKLEIEIVEGARMGPTWQFPGAGSSEKNSTSPRSC